MTMMKILRVKYERKVNIGIIQIRKYSLPLYEWQGVLLIAYPSMAIRSFLSQSLR